MGIGLLLLVNSIYIWLKLVWVNGNGESTLSKLKDNLVPSGNRAPILEHKMNNFLQS